MTDSIDAMSYPMKVSRNGLGISVAIATLMVTLACAATVVLDAKIEPLYAQPGPWQYILSGMPELPVAAAAVLACWIAFISAGRIPLAIPKVPVALMVACAIVLPMAMRVLVFEGYLLEVDEVMLSLQAEMFSQGETAVAVPEGLEHIAYAAHPFMANHDMAGGVWGVFYLPVYAAMLALADLFLSETVLNPLLAGVSVLMVWSIARQLWPDSNLAAPLAALLLLTTPQFLFPAATGFALTAHLAFNLVWLRLILVKGSTRHLVIAAIVGFLAIGLHRPHVHLLFAFPFVAAWVFGWQRRGVATAVAFGAVYAAALYIWLGWADWSIALATGNWSAVPVNPLEFKALARYGQLAEISHGQFEQAFRFWIMGHNLLRLFAWLNPAVLCLFVLGWVMWRALSWTERLVLLSVLTSVLPYTYLMPNPSIGWGYRFAIPALGPMVLGGIAGLSALSGSNPQQNRWPGFVMLTTIFTLAVLFPLHGWRAATDLRAHAAAQAALETKEADIVLVDHYSFRTYHLRNDIDLINRPLFVPLPYLSEAMRRDLCAGSYDIVLASAGEYEALGIEDRNRRFVGSRRDNAAIISDLRARGCRIDDAALRSAG